MANRHPTTDERQALLKLVDSCGLAEVLRVLGQVAANDAPVLADGEKIRTRLCKLAREIQDEGMMGE